MTQEPREFSRITGCLCYSTWSRQANRRWSLLQFVRCQECARVTKHGWEKSEFRTLSCSAAFCPTGALMLVCLLHQNNRPWLYFTWWALTRCAASWLLILRKLHWQPVTSFSASTTPWQVETNGNMGKKRLWFWVRQKNTFSFYWWLFWELLPISFTLEKKMQLSSFWSSCVPPRVKFPGPL